MKQELYETIKELSENIIYPSYENQNEESFERNFEGLLEDLKANDIEAEESEVRECIDLLFEEKEREEEEEKEAKEEYQEQLEHEHFETMRVQSF